MIEEPNQRRPGMVDILRAVSCVASVSIEKLRSDSRRHWLAPARWAVMRMGAARGYSTAKIGQAMWRDHSTVVYGLRQAAALIAQGTERGRMTVELQNAAEDFLADVATSGAWPPIVPPAEAVDAEPKAAPVAQPKPRNTQPRPFVPPAPVPRPANDKLPHGAPASLRSAGLVTPHGYINDRGEIILGRPLGGDWNG